MEQGWDPQVRRYFRKILNSIAWGLIWMIGCVIAGLYYKLGYFDASNPVPAIIFYAVMLISLGLLVRYLYNTWKSQ